nr:enoyl-CoA hydratase-related protein [Janibacter limosus]
MSDDLVYDVSEHIATITLNRPERKNAFTLTMVDEWTDALRESGADDRVRAVVVTGAGDSFCSGVDLSALAEVEATPVGPQGDVDRARPPGGHGTRRPRQAGHRLHARRCGRCRHGHGAAVRHARRRPLDQAHRGLHQGRPRTR